MRIGRERAQQRELLVGEGHLAVANAHLAPRGVDEQVADSPRTLAARVAAAQDRPDPRRDLLVVEWLTDVLLVWAHSGAGLRGLRCVSASSAERPSPGNALTLATVGLPAELRPVCSDGF